jgi:polyisoprenoid-binding protein YceI
MKKYLIGILWIMVNFANAQNWTPSSSNVSFKIKMLGLNVEGTLKGMKANVKFVNNEPTALSASIDSKTVNTANNLRDKHLKEKEEFFQPDLFPIISMNSTSIQKVSDGKYTGTFKLTIKNITKNIKIPFTFIEENNKASLKSDFTINRKDWNFGGDTAGMSDNVKIAITLNMIKN